ncbi:MAG: hypothetical protein PVJ86_11780 [Phycisphaerales bacterium]|jgi:hypothetical protein
MPNPKQGHLTEDDLKKQSQFALGQRRANSFRNDGYENKAALRVRENKPRQSQFQMGRLLINSLTGCAFFT